MNSPFVSVIITTRNEEGNIGNCLVSITKQTYSPSRVEIIVVDNNSSDRTKEIAERFTSKVFNRGPERSAQRNYGIDKAKGEYILFLDADMTLSARVLEECIQKSQKLVGLYIPEIILGDSFWCRVRDFERSFYNTTVIDCVRFFPKKVWQKVEGFDENLTGPEDWDFDRKIRKIGEVDIITLPLYHEEADFNLHDYLKGKDYYGKSIEKYKDKWGKNDIEIKKQLGIYYRYIGVFTEKGKWKKLILHPFLAIGMYFLRFLVGLKYLLSNHEYL